MIIEMKERKL